MTAYPDKALYKIGEVCQYTDTQPYVLRFWESEFPQLAPEKNANGQRVYRKDDIELIFRIKKLLYEEEYTIAGARRKLEQGDAAEPPPKSAKRSPAKTPEAPAAERGKWFEDEPAAPPAEAGPADTALEAEHFRKLHVEAKHENERIAGLHAAAVAEIARLHDEIRALRHEIENRPKAPAKAAAPPVELESLRAEIARLKADIEARRTRNARIAERLETALHALEGAP